MATTFDLTDSATKLPFTGSGAQKFFVLEKEVDCSVNNLGAGDTAQVLHIPAGTYVQQVQIEVSTVEGGTATVDVGSTDTDGWIDGANINAATNAVGAGAYVSAGLLYTAADTIDVLANNALDTAVFTIRAICIDLS